MLFFLCGAYSAYNQTIVDNRLRKTAQAIIRKVLVIRYFAAKRKKCEKGTEFMFIVKFIYEIHKIGIIFARETRNKTNAI